MSELLSQYEDRAHRLDMHLAQFTGLPVTAVRNLRTEHHDEWLELVDEYDEFIRSAPAIEEPSIFAEIWNDIVRSKGMYLIRVLLTVAVLYILYVIITGGLLAMLSPTQ